MDQIPDVVASLTGVNLKESLRRKPQPAPCAHPEPCTALGRSSCRVMRAASPTCSQGQAPPRRESGRLSSVERT